MALADPQQALPGWLAVALVGGTSAVVLVLEILAGRLLAPYVGISLETYTGIIGTVLAGIAAGAWIGGALADRHDPRRLLPLLLMAGGALAIATVPTVRWLGSQRAGVVVLAAAGFLPAATVLSAVTPAVAKLQLRSLAATGTTVGRLSAAGTAGAIAGTFLAGFVLVRWAAVTTLIVTCGLVVMVLGAALWIFDPARRRQHLVLGIAAGALASAGVAGSESPCQFHTRYYCVSIVTDQARPTGRTMVLDDLRHSYVDLADPSFLAFWYVRRIADVVRTAAPPGPIDVVYVGGGGLSLPRHVRDVRPGSRQTVLEIDGDLVELVEERLGFERGTDVRIVVGDARTEMTRLSTDSADVIVGDAFASRAVPWHLTTREFVTELRRVLRPSGTYVANIIDGPRQAFLRAETATVARVFAHVIVVLGPSAGGGGLANSVIVASDQPIAADALAARLTEPGQGGSVVVDIERSTGNAFVLTDDFAPVDQLIARGSQ